MFSTKPQKRVKPLVQMRSRGVYSSFSDLEIVKQNLRSAFSPAKKSIKTEKSAPVKRKDRPLVP